MVGLRICITTGHAGSYEGDLRHHNKSFVPNRIPWNSPFFVQRYDNKIQNMHHLWVNFRQTLVIFWCESAGERTIISRWINQIDDNCRKYGGWQRHILWHLQCQNQYVVGDTIPITTRYDHIRIESVWLRLWNFSEGEVEQLFWVSIGVGSIKLSHAQCWPWLSQVWTVWGCCA